MKEYVVLINEKNKPIGKELKSAVHTNKTPLHRGFSVFVFNAKGELLLQQRSRAKKTWPLIWSNSCCGHPAPNESNTDAVRRRLKKELGLTVDKIHEMLPRYRYKTEMHGIIENEICPVFVTQTEQKPVINKNEVEAIKWIPWMNFQTEVTTSSPPYSAWCKEETRLLHDSEKFQEWFKKLHS